MWEKRNSAIVLAPGQHRHMAEKGMSTARLRRLESPTLNETDPEILAPAGIMQLDLLEDGARHERLNISLAPAPGQGSLSLAVQRGLDALGAVSTKIGGGESMVICDPSKGDLVRSRRATDAARGHDEEFSASHRQENAKERDARDFKSEIERIAGQVARLTENRDEASAVAQEEEEILRALDAASFAAEIHGLLRGRRLREEFFGDKLFADPPWDMMLELLEARLRSKRIPISALCASAGAPPTTALRWINVMTARGLFVRKSDPNDRRRTYVDLSDEAYEGLFRWFARARHYAGLAGA